MASSLNADTIINVDQPIRTLKISSAQLQSAISRAAQTQNWKVKKEREGELSATYHKSDYMAKISIRYAPTYYTINYSDSKRMRYTGTTIHPTYNRLIKALQKNIIKNLKSGNFETASSNSNAPVSCQGTFEVEGDIWSGHRFTASRHISNISKQQALQQAEITIKKAGYTISSSKQGHIEGVKHLKNGRSYPIDIYFSASGSNVRGTINSSMPAGVSVNKESTKKELCKIIDTISSNKNSSTQKEDIQSKLIKVKKLYDAGLITEKEYNTKRKALLKSY